MIIYYPNDPIFFVEPKFNVFKYWNNDILSCFPNKIQSNWHILDIRLSWGFNKFFNNIVIKTFLKELPDDSYIIGVIYNSKNNDYDVLPCFSETVRKNELINDACIRLVKEELFSNSSVYYLNTHKSKNQYIHTYYQNIEDFKIGNLFEEDTFDDKDKSNKISLILFTNNLEKGREFINEWRSKRHNLAGESERLHMTDICLINVKDLY